MAVPHLEGIDLPSSWKGEGGEEGAKYTLTRLSLLKLASNSS